MAGPPQSADDPPGGSSACPHCGELHPPAYTHCPKTGRPLNAGRALIGRVIAGRYRVIGLLGEGGMGAVYIAEHTLIGRKVALKRLHPELASDEKAVKRFQREAQAAAATGHHHIVEILDLGYAEDGAPYLVMEYLRGQSLAGILRKEKRLEPRRACHIVGQVLTALDAVHKQHIVHRDLKPDNVFLTRKNGTQDYVKLLDFGISKVKREEGDGLDLTRTGVMLGTPFYMSPEQARGMKNLDQRVDLYSVGVILYESITGRVPFEGDNYHQLLQAILRFDAPPVRDTVPNIDPGLEAIMLRAIAKDPNTRFDTAQQMLNALLPYGAQLSDEPFESHSVRPSFSPSTSPTPGSMNTMTFEPEDRTELRSQPTPERPYERPAMPSPDRGLPPAAFATREMTPERVVRPQVEQARPQVEQARPQVEQARPQVEQARPRAPEPPRPAPVVEPVRFAQVEPLKAPAPRAPAPRAPLPTAGGGARYFFAASDDWDETRARTVTDGSVRSAVAALRDLASAPAIAREPAMREPFVSGSYARLDSATDASGVRDVFPRDVSTNGAPASGEVALRSAAETDVKGTLVLAALDFLTATHGAPVIERVLSVLDAESRRQLEGVILVPTRVYESLLRAAERTVGAGEGTTSAGIGRATADRELPTTHRLFMQTASPTAAAERIPQVLRLYHSRCEARLSPTPGGGLRLEVDLGAPEAFFHAWAIAGFVQRMLELAGARDVRASVVSCRALRFK
jgi:eukaryotic-like serine/threonine-protein kinase